MVDDAELANINYYLQNDIDFEKLCIGKGKQDDITVVSLWISHRYNHAKVE